MLDAKEIKGLLSPADDALTPSESDRWRQVQRAYDATERMFFGPRVGLDEACERARAWLASVPRL
jgi:hypothetical protein